MSDPVLVIDVAHEAWRCVRESTTARPFASLLARIDALAAEHPRCILALDSPPYDRAAVLPSYKAHRTADPEARAVVGAMLDGLRQSGRVIAEHPGAEADDICATIAVWCHQNGVPCTIATSDKDLAPLIDIARVWDLRTGAEVTRESVRARWGVDPEQIPDMLALGGDDSDGIEGVPGVGLTGAPPTKPGATRTIGGATILLQAFGSLANVLAREPWSAEQIASERKRRDKMRDAAKRAADKKEPDAEAQAALVAEMTRVINLEALVAKVHAHRAAVEQARALVSLRYDVPIDVAALLSREPAQPQPITEETETMQEPTTETVIEEAPAVRVAQPLALRPEVEAPPPVMVIAPRPGAGDFGPEHMRIVREAFAPTASQAEFEVMWAGAKARGLDPVKKQIHFVKRRTKRQERGEWVWVDVWTSIVSIDGFRSIATSTGLYDGQDEPEFEYAEAGGVITARVRVYRKGIARPFVGVARWDEYVQTDKDGKPSSMWAKMAHTMLAKCAEALALRKAFPEHLGGLYTGDEMDQSSNDTITIPAQRRTA